MNFQPSALLLGLLAWPFSAIPKPDAFYRQPMPAKAAPGSLIAVEPYAPAFPGTAAYRVLYTSTDINGARIPVSGVVFIPLNAAPAQGRNIVAWAHPTTGMAQGCAPSLENGGIGATTLSDSIPGMEQFIAAGDIVTATDYPGLGAPGIHPYLIGDAEGRSIIDSVRAARTLPGANVSGKYAVWGHSQGAQAALFAGQISKNYAPELDLVGVAAAAPPTDMNIELTEPFRSNAGRLLAAYVYYSWSQIYHVPITSIVYPQAVPAVDAAITKCIGTLGQAGEAIHTAAALNPVFRSHDPQSVPPWPVLLTENSPGHAPPGAPLLILQGSDDTTVEPHFTRSFAAAACARHEVLEYDERKGVGHLTIARHGAAEAAGWIHDRFAGLKAPDNCEN
jgi:alpha-beta hydrolase superfamily lysophospholipase